MISFSSTLIEVYADLLLLYNRVSLTVTNVFCEKIFLVNEVRECKVIFRNSKTQ